jgi:predicted esterase YcpF (UPF0227 family)
MNSNENFKIYFIHGYESSPDGTKGFLLKKKLGVIPIKYRDCKPEEIIISDCLKNIYENICNDEKVILIGSSLGGFLAAKVAFEKNNVKGIILLNPGIIPPYIDVSKLSGMPQSILQDMQDEKLFLNKICSDIFIFLGTEDEIVPTKWVLNFAMIQEATVRFLKDDHRFTNNINNLPDLIKKII